MLIQTQQINEDTQQKYFISQIQVTQDMLCTHIHIHKQKRQCWTNGSAVKRLTVLAADLGWVSSTRTMPQLLGTPGLGNLTPSSGLLGHSGQVVYIHAGKHKK